MCVFGVCEHNNPYQLVIIAVWVSLFHSIVPPKASATKRNGASVLPSTITPDWSIGTTTPFTVGERLPTVKVTTVSPLTIDFADKGTVANRVFFPSRA